MDKDFIIYDQKNKIKKPINHMLSYLDKHGFNGIVDRMAVPDKYVGRTVMNKTETNRYIYDRICEGKPLMVARYGAVELNYVYHYYKHLLGNKDKQKADRALDMLCFNAGFFPNAHDEAARMVDMYVKASGAMDLCGVWGINMEEYFLKKFAHESSLTKIRFIEPWLMEGGIPWTKALFNKKVLVIHPFTDSMKKQYENRNVLFSARFASDEILPPMDLKFIRAVQSIGGKGASGFKTWIEAYEYMLNQVKNTDFDVAVLGCGAYGFPLAAEIKLMGKQAIHIGGATQIWFGIKGKRWDNEPDVCGLYNEYWTSPSEEEKPVHADNVEGGCYW